MQQHYRPYFTVGIADWYANRDYQLAQHRIEFLQHKILAAETLLYRFFDFRRQSVIVKITGRFRQFLLLAHHHPLMPVPHAVLLRQHTGIFLMHFDIFIFIDYPHIFHGDIVDIADKAAAADTAVTVLQTRHIILQHLGDLGRPHLHLLLFQNKRMPAEKCMKVPPTTKAKISRTAANTASVSRRFYYACSFSSKR